MYIKKLLYIIVYVHPLFIDVERKHNNGAHIPILRDSREKNKFSLLVRTTDENKLFQILPRTHI